MDDLLEKIKILFNEIKSLTYKNINNMCIVNVCNLNDIWNKILGPIRIDHTEVTLLKHKINLIIDLLDNLYELTSFSTTIQNIDSVKLNDIINTMMYMKQEMNSKIDDLIDFCIMIKYNTDKSVKKLNITFDNIERPLEGCSWIVELIEIYIRYNTKLPITTRGMLYRLGKRWEEYTDTERELVDYICDKMLGGIDLSHMTKNLNHWITTNSDIFGCLTTSRGIYIRQLVVI